MDEALARAIDAVGGAAAVGRLYDPPISGQAVSQWRRCPPERVQALARASGIPAEQLRPDVFLPAQS
jgi:DNA-binding transcriptional regulator YdaS (Cro superfamily)